MSNRISDAEFLVASTFVDAVSTPGYTLAVLAVSDNIKHLWAGDSILQDVAGYVHPEPLARGFYLIRCNVRTEFEEVGPGDYAEFLSSLEYVHVKRAGLLHLIKYGYMA